MKKRTRQEKTNKIIITPQYLNAFIDEFRNLINR